MAQLYYFSGTGNTAILANHLASSLAEKTGDEQVPAAIEEVTGSGVKRPLEPPPGLIVILFPFTLQSCDKTSLVALFLWP